MQIQIVNATVNIIVKYLNADQAAEYEDDDFCPSAGWFWRIQNHGWPRGEFKSREEALEAAERYFGGRVMDVTA